MEAPTESEAVALITDSPFLQAMRTLDEACKLLRVRKSKLYMLMRDGELGYVEVGRGSRFIHDLHIERLLQARMGLPLSPVAPRSRESGVQKAPTSQKRSTPAPRAATPKHKVPSRNSARRKISPKVQAKKAGRWEGRGRYTDGDGTVKAIVVRGDARNHVLKKLRAIGAHDVKITSGLKSTPAGQKGRRGDASR